MAWVVQKHTRHAKVEFYWCQGWEGLHCEALERKQPMHISCKRIACERSCIVGRVCAPLVPSVAVAVAVGRPQQRERAAKQERREERRGEERGDGIDGHGVWPWELGHLGRRRAGSLHLRTLRPSLVAVVVAFVPAI